MVNQAIHLTTGLSGLYCDHSYTDPTHASRGAGCGWESVGPRERTADLTETQGLRQLYAGRFDGQADARNALWKVLCSDFFERWVSPADRVVEIAAGQCEFINNVRCSTKTAVDINPDVKTFAAAGVTPLVATSTDMADVPAASADIVFVSNFFEHISRDDIMSTLKETRRILVPEGRLLILQPNIRYCARDYWMFFDHITPVDDRALTEALALAGFRVEKLVRRFLPYTTKGRLRPSPLLLRWYLRLPLAWRLLGKQSFFVARLSALPGTGD